MVRPESYRQAPTVQTVGQNAFNMWLALLDDVFPEDESPRIRAEMRQGTTGKTVAGKDFVKGDACQKDNVSPSLVSKEKGKSRLYGFIRVRAYPDTDKGKESAERFADKTRYDFEGELFVRVRRVYCRDLEEHRWTVWVKQVKEGDKDAPRKARRTKKIRKEGKLITKSTYGGGFQYGRDWGEFRGIAKKTVECPKCKAPVDEACVKDMDFYPRGDSLSNYDAKERRKIRTNPHKERVLKYLEENPSKDAGEQEYRESVKYTEYQQRRIDKESGQDGEV